MGQTGHWDLVILGAGIAGLNALSVATDLLGTDGRVLLVDRRKRPGGMWNDTYDFVRLHQPHPFFTAGDIAWTQGHPREHLARRTEVVDHMAHCVEVCSNRCRVDTRFGWEYVAHDEYDDRVEVTLRDPGGDLATVTGDRLVKAFGYDVQTKPPFAVSSTAVRSISPDDHGMTTGEIARDSAPVWIIGGGKSGMDAALALIQEQPGRDVRMLVGGGTAFLSRDAWFPTGARRWLAKRPNQHAIDYTLRFDGTNEADVQQWLLGPSGCGHSPVDDPRDSMLGLMSRDEVAALRTGVAEFARDHLIDVIDTPDGPVMELRSGATRPVAVGTWLVNCTGYIAREETPYEPYVSPGGRVVSVNPQSALTHLTSFSGFFLTHALLRGLLPLPDLCAVDLVATTTKAKAAVGVVMMTTTLHNISVFFDALPVSVFTSSKIDFDGWQPPPRVLAGSLRFLATHHRVRARHRAALEAFARERGVRVGSVSD
ncbi:FAD-dependent oxidoreductase [Nocardioides sp.]|uniref:FAD-dependent oxidoreductase n=1 Tax=Nocardioides sp. TaxID=35761 RepID=UPI002CB57FBC|nr:FAD-dependent oxidoreductase [Nocardioides sp.]HSX68347.1 FAD-dependent oxidoreductase [Nocardioides sp.]